MAKTHQLSNICFTFPPRPEGTGGPVRSASLGQQKTHQLSNICFTFCLDLKELADLSGQPLWDGLTDDEILYIPNGESWNNYTNRKNRQKSSYKGDKIHCVLNTESLNIYTKRKNR